MTQQQETQASSDIAHVRGWPRLIVAAGGFVVGAVVEYLIGLDAFWPVLVAAVVTGALAWIVDIGLSRAIGRIGRHMKVTQIAAVVAIALAVGLFYRAERNDAFSKAFGIVPPHGLSHVDIDHVTAKETGRRLTIVEFQANRATLDALIGSRKFAQDTKAAVKPGKEAAAQRPLWGRAFRRYGVSIEDRWKTRLPVTDPVIYHWVGTDRDTLEQQTSVLWDAASGRGCAIHASS